LASLAASLSNRENAANLAQAEAIWEATNNTLGLNHGIGSAADGQFMCLETKAGECSCLLLQ
jgi:hypothetical protein